MFFFLRRRFRIGIYSIFFSVTLFFRCNICTSAIFLFMSAEGQNHWYLQCFGRFLNFLHFPENRPIELLVFFWVWGTFMFFVDRIFEAFWGCRKILTTTSRTTTSGIMMLISYKHGKPSSEVYCSLHSPIPTS